MLESFYPEKCWSRRSGAVFPGRNFCRWLCLSPRRSGERSTARRSTPLDWSSKDSFPECRQRTITAPETLPPPDETATTVSPDAAPVDGSVDLALNFQVPFLATTASPTTGPSNAPR